jgi:hypothetical protein
MDLYLLFREILILYKYIETYKKNFVIVKYGDRKSPIGDYDFQYRGY